MSEFSVGRLILTLVCALLADVSPASDDLAPAPVDSKIHIYKQGDMYGGCSGPGAFRVPGHWLALRLSHLGWELESARLRQTQDGTLTSNIRDAKYYINDVAGVHSGLVRAVPVKQRRLPALLWTKTSFQFGGQSWTFVEWGGFEDTYFLDDGNHHYAISRRDLPLSIETSKAEHDAEVQQIAELIPSAIRLPTEASDMKFMTQAREEDNSGAAIAWAGDLDHDGRLDLIIEHSAKEGSASSLWLSAPAGAGGSIMVEAANSDQGCS